MTDMFKDQLVEDFGAGSEAIWHNQKVKVVSAIPPKSWVIEYRVPDETKPLTRIVDVSELSPVIAAYVQIETANEPMPGSPIPPRDSAKPLTEAEKEAARRDIMGDDEPDASDAYAEALDELRAEKARLELENQRLKAENKAAAERATKAEGEAGKRAFAEVDHWKKIAEAAQRDLAAVRVKPAPKTQKEFVVDRNAAAHNLEKRVAEGWKIETIQFTPHNEGEIHFPAELNVVFSREVEIEPVQPQPPLSVAAVLTGDYVREEMLHRDPAPEAAAAERLQMPKPPVNQMPDGPERDDRLYENRARIQGKKKAARGTYIIPRANAKRMRETFAKNFPTATRILERGKDAVLDEMNDQAKAAFTATYLKALGVQPTFTQLLPLSGE
jgi:hypothetical protein